MTLLAVEFPGVEFLIFAVALLLGLIGKIVEFAKQMRQKSIEAEQRQDRQFGEELGEAPEPREVEALPVRLDLVRRPMPRRELPPPVPPETVVVVRPPPPPTLAPPRAHPEHPVLRLLRGPHGAKDAIVLAAILGPPKALRRRR